MNQSLRALLLVAAATATPRLEAATVAEWRRDLDAIVRDIRAFHPAPFTRVGELTFLRAARALEASLAELDEAQRVVGLMRLVAALGDGHTGIEIQERDHALWYPFRLYEFSDGYFVTCAHQSARELVGAQVLSIAGRPVEEVVNAARSLFGADNEFDSRERLYAVHNAFLMRGLGFASEDGRVDLEVRLRSGGVVERSIAPRPADDRYPPGVPIFEWAFASEVYGLPFGPPEEWLSAYLELPSSAFATVDPERPLFLQHRAPYTSRALPEHDAFYMQINQTDDSSMVGFVGESLRLIDAQRPRRLILDLRYNFGGDGSKVNSMIHELIRREGDLPWRELYVVTGRKTFSAGVMVLDALIDHTRLSIVGEPAGAALNSYGDAVSRPYPSLGLDLKVSTLRHQLGDSADLRAIVPVDVPRLQSFADYAAGRDPAVDDILAGVEMRSIQEIARMDGGKAARRAYLERRARFAELAWWTPPEEIALRFAAGDLLADDRFEDALETCRLNTEIHPYVWNTWLNLGWAQRRAGDLEGSSSSYRCVVELEPSNWNVPAILQLFEETGATPELPEGCPAGR